MSVLKAMLRSVIRIVDTLVRRSLRVWEFTQDPECLLRLSLSHSPVTVTLSDGTLLQRGAPVCILHLWNERLPQSTVGDPSLGSARQLYRRFAYSLRLVAEYAASEPRLHDAVAFGGETSVFSAQALGHPEELLPRWGFDYIALPSSTALPKRVGRFFDRFYTWLLMYTFNPGTLCGKTLSGIGRGQVWTSRARLMAWRTQKRNTTA